MRRTYRQWTVTQDDVNQAAREIQAQLTGLPLVVQPNGNGHRIECTVCRWSQCHGTIQHARDHASTH